jgi:hypothetical protein
MANLINSDKAKIVDLVKTWRKRSGLTVKYVVARIQASGCDISQAQFENHFTTRLEQEPGIPPEYVLALIQVFTERLLEHERCQAQEAIELAILARFPVDQLRTLQRFFPAQEFDIAYQRYLLTLVDRDQAGKHLADIDIVRSIPYDLPHADWGESPDVSVFYGRQAELAELKQWIVADRCRVVGVLGIGGVGKTALATRLAEQIKDQFDYVIWRSLRNAPPLDDILGECIQFLSDWRDNDLPQSTDRRISRLIDYLREQRCLLIVDNLEAILRGGEWAGRYQAGYEAYGELLRRIGETRHQSCLVLSRRARDL